MVLSMYHIIILRQPQLLPIRNIIIYYERKRIQSSEQLGMNRYRHHYEIGSRKQAIVVSASVKRSAYSGGA